MAPFKIRCPFYLSAIFSHCEEFSHRKTLYSHKNWLFLILGTIFAIFTNTEQQFFHLLINMCEKQIRMIASSTLSPIPMVGDAVFFLLFCYISAMANSRRDKADSYTQRAHKEGYPARSVYKLEEINAKEKLIKPGDSVLDVGAAPGSWTLYTHRMLIKGKGRIVSCDLNPLSLDPVPPTVTEITGDAFSKEIRARLTELGPYDAIISDAAPMTTGNRTVDTTRSEGLASEVVRLAEEQLKKGGNLVIKIFQGGGEQEILRHMREMFKKAKAFKPKASRDDSFEIFLIGLEKK